MMNTQKTAVTEPQKKGVINRMFERFAFRAKFNRNALNIQAADLLRQEIAAQKITQKAIAEKLDISPARLSQILNTEEKNLTLGSIADIATALDMRFKLALEVDTRNPQSNINQTRIIIQQNHWTTDWTTNPQESPDYVYCEN